MPWQVIKGRTFWWPDDINENQRELLAGPVGAMRWPELYVSGTTEDDVLIQFLQIIEQPFTVISVDDSKDELAVDLKSEIKRPAFFHPQLTARPLVGVRRIKEQYDFRRNISPEESIVVPQI